MLVAANMQSCRHALVLAGGVFVRPPAPPINKETDPVAIGDHLFIQYSTFQHHGIDLGPPDDSTVSEFGGKGTGLLSVRRVLLRDFLAH